MPATVGNTQVSAGEELVEYFPIWNDPGRPTLWVHIGVTPEDQAENRAFAERVADLINRDDAGNYLTDSQGRTWHIMERDGGSISVYYTLPDSPAHYIVFDSLDTGLDEAADE